MQPETKFKLKVMKFIKQNYKQSMVIKLANSTCSGYPDLCVLNNSKCYFIELKVGRNKASKIQEYFIKAINATGNFAGVAYDIATIKEILDKAKQIK